MFEDLRKDGEASPFFQQQDDFDPLLDGPANKKKRSSSNSSGKGGLNIKFNRKFLGMTPFQRFAISFALLIMVFFSGLAFLLVTGSIVVF